MADKATTSTIDIFINDVGPTKPSYKVTYGWPGSRKNRGSRKLKGTYGDFGAAIKATEEIEAEFGLR